MWSPIVRSSRGYPAVLGPGARRRAWQKGNAGMCQWRRRYAEAGLAGLKTRERSGRPRRVSDAKERAVVAIAPALRDRLSNCRGAPAGRSDDSGATCGMAGVPYRKLPFRSELGPPATRRPRAGNVPGATLLSHRGA